MDVEGNVSGDGTSGSDADGGHIGVNDGGLQALKARLEITVRWL